MTNGLDAPGPAEVDRAVEVIARSLVGDARAKLEADGEEPSCGRVLEEALEVLEGKFLDDVAERVEALAEGAE